MPDVLIIDDDPDNADALSEVMRLEGHVVRVGYDGRQGMDLVNSRFPDVALLDVEMPVLSGPEMAYQMFVHDMGLENIPIVLLSGVPNLKDVAAQVGTPYFLGKPYRYDRLLELVNRALRERYAPRPPSQLR